MLTVSRVENIDNSSLCIAIEKLQLNTSAESFFNTSFWIISWIKSLPKLPRVYFLRDKQDIVGIGLANVTAPKAGLSLFSKGWLNQMGDIKYDQSWIEYNAIYCSSRNQLECTRVLLDYFMNQEPLNEFYISMTHQMDLWLNEAIRINRKCDTKKISGFRKTLTKNQSTDTLLGTLSKNARSQLRRSLKKTNEQFGTIQLEESTRSEQQAFLSELAKLHITQWQQTCDGSGFSNSTFIEQQKNLLRDACEHIAILRVTAGDTLLGYTYNFVWRDTVYFYCSGINHDIENKHIKPGYIVHLYAMEHFAAKGFKTYDFLGGESQYKRTLADQEYTFHQISIYNNNLSGRMLTLLKKLNRWRQSL